MAEFSRDKAGRWLDRIAKRLGLLTEEEKSQYQQLRASHNQGDKFDAHQVKVLTALEKRDGK